MKNVFPRLSRISLNDWLEYHPYDGETPSDHFYIDLGNDVQYEALHIDLSDQLAGADYKHLACLLACYLEDITSRTGMWTSFIDEHRRLYGKYLPFFDMAGYERGDVNLADVQFLVWHFCSNLPAQNRFIDPYSIENAEIAQVAYSLLNEAAGQAPVNDDLKAAMTLAPDAGFDTVAKRLDFFFFGCYLHHYYTTAMMEDELLNLRNQKISAKDFDMHRADRRAHLLFNKVSPLLAQSSGEMLGRWVGESHPLHKMLMSLSKRKEGLFLYEKNTGTHLQMKHIATGIRVELNNPDWRFPLAEGKTAVRMGMVQWGDGWYATGASFPAADAEIAEITEREKCLFAPAASHLGVVRREEECFMEIGGNNRIVFLGSKREAFALIDNVWETYHLRYGANSMDRKLFDVHALTFGVDDDLENLAVFFNQRAGIEFYPDIARCVSAEINKAETDIEELMLDERASSDFILFLIENRMIEIEPVSGSGGYHYVWNNCDFLLRYWKKDRYISEPKLFVE